MISLLGRRNGTITVCCWFLGMCGPGLELARAASTNNAGTSVQATFSNFVGEKRALAESMGAKHGQQLSAKVLEFFADAQKGDWNTASNLFAEIETGNRSASGNWSPPVYWGAIQDAYGTYELVHAWNPDFLELFGEGIVKSIPAGSIYFGGTAAGRYAVSMFSLSHSQGLPFFTLTQNALSDESYVGYLRDMYGGKINLPNDSDIERCVEEYKKDAQARWEHDQAHPMEPRQLKRGEDVRVVNGQLQMNNGVSVMAVHALLLKFTMTKNPDRQFYYEESYEMETINPLLTPQGYIFKINRDPASVLSAEIVRADREFWTRKTDAWLGTWLKPSSTVEDITNFVQRTYIEKKLESFSGDVQFIRDGEAREAFAKLRCSIAGLYAWRASKARDNAERERMMTEADFAFRQAFAICPSSAEVVMRYADLLIPSGRMSDALSVVSIGCELYPEHPAMHYLLTQLHAAVKK